MQALDGRLVLSPSDLNDYVECPHLTTLALEVARGTPQAAVRPQRARRSPPPQRRGARGRLPGLAARRRADRWSTSSAPIAGISTARRAHDRGDAGGCRGHLPGDVRGGDWRGRADFLERVEQPTALGGWGYEALDAKLARAEKPTYVLQLCFYTEAIAAIQQAPVGAMHVLLGIGERRTLRPDDFTAYYRRVRAGFLEAIGRGAPTEPYRVDHCGSVRISRGV